MITYLNKNIEDLMTKEVISVTPNTNMIDVAKVFKSNNFHHIPVIEENGKCIGLISKMDYYQLQDSFTRLNESKSEWKNTRFLSTLLAEEIMSKDPISIDRKENISTLIPIFLANTAHSVIVKDDNQYCGIITPFDLLKYMQEILISYQKAIV